MERFLRFWSYLSSPLLIPFLISWWYLSYALGGDSREVLSQLLLIAGLTIALPLVLYAVLKFVKNVDDIHLSSTKERLIPLIAYSILIITLLKIGLTGAATRPLYFFFIGILLSAIIALILALFQFKISLHMMAVAGATTFIAMISLAYKVNLIHLIAIGIVIIGLTATSRLSMKAHSPIELVFGTLMGVAIQIMVTTYYL